MMKLKKKSIKTKTLKTTRSTWIYPLSTILGLWSQNNKIESKKINHEIYFTINSILKNQIEKKLINNKKKIQINRVKLPNQ